MAGVSSSTVSRALSGSNLVNPETRQRIQEVASRYNYTVNRLAMELRSGTNNTIAVVVPYEDHCRQTFADPFFHAMIGALADALTERGYEMLLMRLEANRIDSIAALVDSGRVAGVILIGQWRQHDELNALASRSIPFVVWGAHLEGQRYCSIGGDNLIGGRLAGEHLIAQGRRHPVFLGDRDLPEVALRYTGFHQALRKASIALPRSRSITVSFLPQDGRQATLDLIASGEPVDAIFASSDVLAMAAIGALRENDLRVPDDVSVVGYDDVGMAAHFSPPLTTIRQPIDAGGPLIIDTLAGLIAGRPVEDVPMLPTALVVRGSSVVPPDTAPVRQRRKSRS